VGEKRLGDRVAEALRRVDELEQAVARTRRAFSARYEDERERQTAELWRLVGDTGLRRGLALASPDFTAALARSGATAELVPRKARKLTQGLIRYLTRSALKLSPYSSLTRVARAATGGPTRGGLALAPGPWRERSLLRLRRYAFNQLRDALLLRPEVRASLEVELNSSRERSEGGVWRMYRPGRWRFEVDGGPRYQPEALVCARVSEELSEALEARLAAAPTTLAELLEDLVGDGDDEDRRGVARALEELLALGFLVIRNPWPADETSCERPLARTLRAHPDCSGLVHRLESLEALERGFRRAADPAIAVEGLHRLHTEIDAAALRIGGIHAAVAAGREKTAFYEDVILEPAGRKPLVTLSRDVALRLLEDARPLMRLAGLFDRRQDFALTAAETLRRVWPGRRKVGVLEGLEQLRLLFDRFLAEEEHREVGAPAAGAFDPLDLDRLGTLARVRAQVARGLAGCVEQRGGESRIDGTALEELLREVPAASSLVVEPALLIQPAGISDRWVVNALVEGTGRWGSRYTPLLAPREQERYARHLVERSGSGGGLDGFELLDVVAVRGDTLGVHSPQTARALELPGETTRWPAHRCLALKDLRLRYDGEDGALRLVDGADRCYLPVHLGLGTYRFLPPLLRFLCLLGPGELRPVFPPARVIHCRGIGERRCRLVLGSLVLRRQAWRLSVNELRQELRELERRPDRCYLAVQRWKDRYRIPDRIFIAESVQHETLGQRRKPQFLDLRSPLFVELLVAILKQPSEHVHLEEALPAPERLPQDAGGRRWAVEVLLDGLAFRAAPRRRSPAPARRRAPPLGSPSLPMPRVAAGGI
jgi:hypothetical protein